MKQLILVALLALTASSCAMSRSHFESADGDIANKMAVSTVGKQEVQQKTSFQVYPNNSGMDLQDGAISSQDTTQVTALLQSMMQAYVGMLSAKPQTPEANDPTVIQRILQLTQQVEQMRTLLDAIRKP
jgi:hypothetical protein